MDLNVKDAARLLGVSENQIYAWIRGGALPSYQVGDKCRLNRVELLEWASVRKMKVSPEFFRANGTTPNLLLTRAIRSGGVIYDLPCVDKGSALKAACDAMPLPPTVDRAELHSVLVAREALCSTGIGNGVAIPHPRGPLVLGVAEPQVTLAFPTQPIDYGSVDFKPVSMLFVIVSTTVRVHLSLLSHLMYVLQDVEFRALLDTRASRDRLFGRLEAIELSIASGPDTSHG